MSFEDITPDLIESLRLLGEDYGPMAVALTAAELTDPYVLIRLLQAGAEPTVGPTEPRSARLVIEGSRTFSNAEILSAIRWMLSRRAPDDFPESVFPSEAGAATVPLWDEEEDE